MRRRRWVPVVLFAAVSIAAGLVVRQVTTRARPAIRVQGNRLVDGSGRALRLFGVNRSGTEYQCVIGGPSGAGIFSGPSDVASIAAMAAWHVNAVRVPLNEDCWLGINGVNAAHSGPRYRGAIARFVASLTHAGLVTILDLHWNAPGTALSDGQQLMADADHAPAFWTSVATRFKANPAVMFDLYNEPNGISWTCWLSGCVTTEGWRAAGMQTLVDAVRRTGARQVIIAAGLGHANDLSQWLRYQPRDPVHQLVAGVHVYDTGPSDYCNTVPCWDDTIGRVAREVAVVTSEIGEHDRRSDFVTGYMEWADGQARAGRSVSFLGWSWDAAQGEGGPSLIRSFDATPTTYGLGFRAYLARLFEQGRIARL